MHFFFVWFWVPVAVMHVLPGGYHVDSQSSPSWMIDGSGFRGTLKQRLTPVIAISLMVSIIYSNHSLNRKHCPRATCFCATCLAIIVKYLSLSDVLLRFPKKKTQFCKTIQTSCWDVAIHCVVLVTSPSSQQLTAEPIRCTTTYTLTFNSDHKPVPFLR